MLVSEKRGIYSSVELSLREISYVMAGCMCTRSTTSSFARADDAKFVRSRDAQCNTEESP